MPSSLNYIDTYHRSGLYPVKLPSGIGLEAAGKVDEVGKDVTEFNKGITLHMHLFRLEPNNKE